MAIPLDTESTYPLSEDSSESVDVAIKSVPFGDGYGQSTVDGINEDKEVWNFAFQRQPLAASFTLRNLLRDSRKGTANVLSWIPPGDSETKYWEATNVKRQPLKGPWWRVSCTLTRVYPIGV